jgi:LmbE family N-acetylglucosaminyl deacetylase
MKRLRHYLLPAGLMGLLLLLSALYFRSMAQGVPALNDLTPIPLAGHQRLLVLAPHCDDETLGAAGAILAAHRAGLDVQVVIATNGDGYRFATMEDFRRLYPHAQDFVRMGNLRQQESLAAMRVLGVNSAQVIFLSYPDRGTPALWNTHWSASAPYRSPYTEATRSPYPATYNPNSVFAGEDYLADLRSILAAYHPDLIIYPHPDDVHPDHWGLSVFTRLALAQLEQADPAYRPEAYAYLVHRPDFPTTKGLRPADTLMPPPLLYRISPDWFRIDLSATDTALKGEAVQQYTSQLPLLRGLMESLTRADEPFARPEPASLPTLHAGTPFDPAAWYDASGQMIGPVQKDPLRDNLSRLMVADADLTALYAARTADGSLVVCAQVRGRAIATLDYLLRIKSVGAEITSRVASSPEVQAGQVRATRSGAYVCDTVKLSDLGHPWLLLLAGDVEATGTGTLDQIAWQLVYVNGRP